MKISIKIEFTENNVGEYEFTTLEEARDHLDFSARVYRNSHKAIQQGNAAVAPIHKPMDWSCECESCAKVMAEITRGFNGSACS